MRNLVLVTTLIILAFTICTGCSKGSSAVNPDIPSGDELAQAEMQNARSSQFLLWMYDVSIDYDSLSYSMNPIQVRNAQNIGDSFEVEIGKFMTGWFQGIQCLDCLMITKIGLHGNGDILLDVRMKHPFDSSWLSRRRDLDVFDPRLILIVDGTDTRFDQTNGVGIDDDPIQGNFSFLKNADGYTSHFDNRAELPEFIGTPRNYRGNVNPFKYFFVDIDPDPLIYSKENEDHRMRMGNKTDTQRLRIASPGAGSTVEFIFAVEVSYVHSAKQYTRLSPVYHLPEGNQKEAYRIMTNMPRTLVEGAGTPINFNVYVEDWQNRTPTGPLQDQVRAQSDVAQVSVEIPGISSSIAGVTIPVSGTGVAYDPYVFSFSSLPVDMNPTMAGSPYLALFAAEDELNDRLRADVYYNFEPLDDFVAYKIYPVSVIAPGTCPVITIYDYSVNTGAGTCTITGEILYLDQTSTVTLTHGKFGDATTYRTYPLNVDFDGSFMVTVVLFIGSNEISFDADNQFCADSETLPIVNYSPTPPFPRFRVTLYWQPQTPDPLDSTDMDLHMWFSEGALIEDYHCYYDDNTIGDLNNGYVVLNVDDPDGYGPENMDGKDGTAGMREGYYPVAVNYFSNHRGLMGYPIDFKVRILLNPGTVNEAVEDWPAGAGNFYTLNVESFNDQVFYPVTDNTLSWYRVRDIQINSSGVASTVPPDITRQLFL
jgi:uncharacterized protein YfaP (DUF2135 family)